MLHGLDLLSHRSETRKIDGKNSKVFEHLDCELCKPMKNLQKEKAITYISKEGVSFESNEKVFRIDNVDNITLSLMMLSYLNK